MVSHPCNAWLLSTAEIVTIRSFSQESGLDGVANGKVGRGQGSPERLAEGWGTAGTGPAFLQCR